jgi:hypothetical protein
MRAKLGQLIGIPEQRENAIADQVGGGEVAGDQQQVAGDARRAVRGHHRRFARSSDPDGRLAGRLAEEIRLGGAADTRW